MNVYYLDYRAARFSPLLISIKRFRPSAARDFPAPPKSAW